MHWYFVALKKYTVFSGRSQRTEFWFFTLINALVLAIFVFAYSLLAGMAQVSERAFSAGYDVLVAVWMLATILPSLAVSVRRLHDIGWSGWWVLLWFVPFAGGVILLVLFTMDSQPGTNVYGPNPKTMPSVAPS
jgi:uncharacterized membrane protein YhaH (DUF805 family)